MPSHPIHPALAHFPIGAWGIASGLDTLVLFGVKPGALWPISTRLIGLGLVLALATMVAGAWDLSRIFKRQNTLIDPAIHHVSVMVIVWCLYLAAFLLRLQGGAIMPISMLAITLSILSFIGLMVGGWLGGNLVYGHGANVIPVLEKEK